MRAAVLTISSSRTRREDDESGNALVGLLRGGGHRDGLRLGQRRPRGDSHGAQAAGRQRARALHLHHRRHRTHVRRRDARGHARRDRPRGAGLRRGDPGGVAPHTPLGILTRGVSGIRGRTLIVNFPGSPKAVRQSWPVVEPTLRHAAETLERELSRPRRRSSRSRVSSAATGSGPRSATCRSSWPRARRSASSAPTARASPHCCACWPRCCARTPAGVRVLGAHAAGRVLEGARARGLRRPRAAALPRAERAREPRLPRAAPPRAGGARGRADHARWACSAARAIRCASCRAAWCSGCRPRAPCCTTRRCCSSTSPTRASTPPRASCSTR